MKFELLPNEIIIEYFEYLIGMHIKLNLLIYEILHGFQQKQILI